MGTEANRHARARTASGASTTARPGVLERLRRSPVHAAAYALFSVLLIASSILGWLTMTSVQASLGEHWRGDYDILVTGSEQTQDTQNGLIDPNFANSSGAVTITRDQLARISNLANVDVAAPIGFVGRVTPRALYPNIAIPIPKQTTAYRLTVTMSADDGFGSRIVQHYTSDLILGANAPRSGILSRDVFGSNQFLPQIVRDGRAYVLLSPLPTIASTVIAIDPTAERKLLGTQGDFLKPLQQYDALQKVSGPITCKSAEQLPQSSQQLLHALGAPDRAEVNSAFHCAYGASSSFAPFIRNVRAYPDASLTMNVAAVDASPASTSRDALDALKADSSLPLGTTTVNLTDRLRPFGSSNVNIPWLGEPVPKLPLTYASPSIPATSAAPLEVQSGDPLSPLLTLTPQGVIAADGKPAQGQGTDLGSSQTYRVSANSTVPRIGSYAIPGAAPLEVASYDPARIHGVDPLVGTPLGANGPAHIRVTNPKSGADSVLQPSLSALGPAIASASAITSLTGAATMGVQDPIDAVRVRVAGIGQRSSGAIRRISEVAQEIDRLGLHAIVVTGSSYQDVRLAMPDFLTGPSSPAESVTTIASLKGTQPLVRLGAAADVQSTLTDVSTGVYAGSVGAAALLVVGVQALSVPQRRRASQVMSRSGIGRRRRLLWYFGPDSLPAIVPAVAVGAMTVSGVTAAGSQYVAVGAFLAVALSAILCSFASSQAETKGPGRLRSIAEPPVKSPLTLGIRNALSSPLLTVIRATALVVVVLGFAQFAALVPTLLRRATLTQLGAAVLGSTAIIHTAAAVLACAAGIVILALIERVDVLRRARQVTSLSESAGWSQRELRRSTTTNLACAYLVAALTLAGVVWSTHAVIDELFMTAAVATFVIAAVVSVNAAWIADRRAQSRNEVSL